MARNVNTENFFEQFKHLIPKDYHTKFCDNTDEIFQTMTDSKLKIEKFEAYDTFFGHRFVLLTDFEYFLKALANLLLTHDVNPSGDLTFLTKTVEDIAAAVITVKPYWEKDIKQIVRKFYQNGFTFTNHRGS